MKVESILVWTLLAGCWTYILVSEGLWRGLFVIASISAFIFAWVLLMGVARVIDRRLARRRQLREAGIR